jgi:hypothetical protein
MEKAWTARRGCFLVGWKCLRLERRLVLLGCSARKPTVHFGTGNLKQLLSKSPFQGLGL